MHTTTLILAVTGMLVAAAPEAWAQTAPVPRTQIGDSIGLLPRAEFFLSLAVMKTDDPRFSLVQRSRSDLDVVGYRKGRINFLVDTELVMGSERRTFDLNQANVIFETSASYRLGQLEVAALGHHHSRHVVDREFDRVPAWHTLGARASWPIVTPQTTADVTLELARVVQHTFVDYAWTSQLTVRVERTLGSGARIFANGMGGFVGVDPDEVNRDRQIGARAEGGVELPGRRGSAQLFIAYERRIDGYPISRDPSSWLELAFRLGVR
jgi:hypothetical protein